MLFGNNALFLRNPVRAIGGLNQATERANWGAWGATRNFYAGEATVISGSSIANTAGSPVGYKPPVSYSWPIKDGVDQKRINAAITVTAAVLAGSLVSGRNLTVSALGGQGGAAGASSFIDIRQLTAALTASGGIDTVSMGLIANLIVSGLGGSGTINASTLDMIYAMVGAITASGELEGVGSGIGHLDADLTASGTLAGASVSGGVGVPGYLYADLDSLGDVLTTANIAPAVWDALCESGVTNKAALRIILATLAGKISGAPTGPIVIRDVNDTTDRVTASVDVNGNRTAVTLDAD